MSEFVTGVIEVTESEYHADPFDPPSLSSSIANLLMAKSPAHAWAQHPKLGGLPWKSSDAFIKGTVIHRLLLGKGADYEAVDFDSWRTKASKEEREEITARGNVPILREQLERCEEAVLPIVQNLAEHGIALTGEAEVAMAWAEEAAGGEQVQCRGRVDLVDFETGTILDLKSAANAHPDSATKSVINFGYDLQSAAYVRGFERVRPELAGRVKYELAFLELEPPYAVCAAPLGGSFQERGDMRWSIAVDRWEQCLRTNEWPGYPRTRLEAPAWLMAKEMA